MVQDVDCDVVFGRGNICTSFIAGTDDETKSPVAIMKLYELETTGESGRMLSDSEKEYVAKQEPILIVAFENKESVNVVQRWLELIEKFFKEREQNG